VTVDVFAAMERNADVGNFRPALAPHVEVARFTSRWHGSHAVIHDPRTARYARLSAAEADLAESLRGELTVRELVVQGLDDGAFRPEPVVDLVTFLHRGGFLAQPWVDTYALLRDRTEVERHPVLLRVWRTLRHLTIALPGAPALVVATYRRAGRHAFRPAAAAGAFAVFVGGIAAFLVLLGRTGDFELLGTPTAHGAAVLYVLGLGALLCHELGHGLAVVHAGRRILGAGFRVSVGNPAFFIDTSDIVMADRRARALNAIAGPFAEGVVAGLASIAALVVGPTPVGENLFRFAGFTYILMLLNLVPFLELDGYWLLTDLLEIPDLRPRALAYLRHDLPDLVRERRRPRRSEVALLLFGALGVVFSAAALVLAWFVWAPLVAVFGAALWRSGPAGRVVLVLLGLLVLGPVAHVLGDGARALDRRLRAARAALQFRLERRWRVAAGELLASLPGAERLGADELEQLAARVRRRRFSSGEALVRQGETADSFFLLRRGTCAISERTPDGAESVIARIGPGATFGELALLEGTPRTATVRAETDGEAFVVDAAAFQRLLADVLAPPSLAPAAWPVTDVWALPPFRHLDLAAATAVAMGGRWVRIAPGVAVVEEGDAGDEFFVVASGQLEAWRGGESVGMFRAGEFFGELALLRDVARTATVRAVTPARLFAVPRHVFDEVVRASFDAGSLSAYPLHESHYAWLGQP
jgi:putative peptide zinc metalloprotease protein